MLHRDERGRRPLIRGEDIHAYLPTFKFTNSRSAMEALHCNEYIEGDTCGRRSSRPLDRSGARVANKSRRACASTLPLVHRDITETHGVPDGYAKNFTLHRKLADPKPGF